MKSFDKLLNEPNEILIWDETLRDGEQTLDVYFDLDNKNRKRNYNLNYKNYLSSTLGLSEEKILKLAAKTNLARAEVEVIVRRLLRI